MLIPDHAFSDAIRGFWDKRLAQKLAQELEGRLDKGTRSEVTGGKQMDGFALTLTNLLQSVGLSEVSIHVKKGLTVVPGFFRPTKTYDFLIVHEGQFRAAIELKSQVGPSFGNNFNNRVEEAMGSALDIWKAYRENAFGDILPPWVGYLMLLEDSPESRSPIRVSEPHFQVLPEFRNSSYASRYELFCRKMVKERHYSAACFLLSDRNKAMQEMNYIEPAEDLSARTFLTDLLRQFIEL